MPGDREGYDKNLSDESFLGSTFKDLSRLFGHPHLVTKSFIGAPCLFQHTEGFPVRRI